MISQKTLIYTDAISALFEMSIFGSIAAHKAMLFQTRDNTKWNALIVNANTSFDKSRKYKRLPLKQFTATSIYKFITVQTAAGYSCQIHFKTILLIRPMTSRVLSAFLYENFVSIFLSSFTSAS